MRPPEAENPGEKLYESWDCPQVIAKHAYENNEPDVLNLDIGDVVNVIRKLPDGMFTWFSRNFLQLQNFFVLILHRLV